MTLNALAVRCSSGGGGGGDPAGRLLDEAQVIMEDVEDGPSGDRGQMSHINTSVLLNEPPDIVDHLLSPDKLVDGLAPVVLHVLAVLDLLDDVVDLGPTHGLVTEGLGHDFSD